MSDRITLGTSEERKRLRDLAFEGREVHKVGEYREAFVIFEKGRFWGCYLGAAVVAQFDGDFSLIEKALQMQGVSVALCQERHLAKLLDIDIALLDHVSRMHEKGASESDIGEALLPEPIAEPASKPIVPIWEAELPVEEFENVRR